MDTVTVVGFKQVATMTFEMCIISQETKRDVH